MQRLRPPLCLPSPTFADGMPGDHLGSLERLASHLQTASLDLMAGESKCL